MIPLKLTIQGLFSYQGKQTIDFQKLTEAHLFGIFGSVGSGKSSILDAITFALYGETERMNARDNRNYNMMNLKSDELFIEFDFSAGNGSTLYRSVVKGKRNRKRFEDVKTLDRSGYKNIDGTWEPIEIEQIQQVIGLSYENFKRTIIIPQGRFQEFLQLGNKDRTQMMKELFNLGKFELYYKTVALETKNNQQMQQHQGQLQQLGEVNPDQLTEAKLRVNAISSELKLLTDQLSSKQNEETVLGQLKILVFKLKEQQSRFEFLKTKEVEILNSEKSLQIYEHCLFNYKNLFDRQDEMDEGIEQLKRTIEDVSLVLKESTTQLTTLEPDFAKIKADYEQRDQLKLQAGELVKIVRIIALNDENSKLAGRITNGEEICARSENNVQGNKKLQDQLEEELKSLKFRLPDLAELSKVQNWFTIRKSIDATILEQVKELEVIKAEINTLNERFKNNIASSDLGADQNIGIAAALNFLTQRISQSRDLIAIIDKNTEHLLIRDKLEEFAKNLVEGKPCPLCGSTSHPDILDGGDVKIALQNERDSKIRQENIIQSLEKMMVNLREIQTQLHLKHENIQKLTIKQSENQIKIDTHQSLFIWPEFENERILIQAFKEVESMALLIKSKDIQLGKLRMESENEQKALINYRRELDKIREQLTINHSEINTLTQQIEILDVQAYISKSVVQVKQLADLLFLKYAALESVYQKTASEVVLVQKRRDESSGKLQANQLILVQQQKSQELIKIQIDRLLAVSDYSSVNQIKTVLNQKIDLDAEKQKIQNFRQQLQLTENQLYLLKTDLGERIYLPDGHQKLKEDISKLREVQAEKNRELGKTEGEIRKLSKDLDQQKEIRKLLDHLELRAENIKTMKQLFKGSGFVNYVSSVHLHNLCLAANDRFYKLVRQKMSLEITEDNNFQVRDFLNGGKVRSVKTLSGGQTFQASLSLALSLADSIQQFTESSQNFFFLDEGFGSLDKDALDVVFDTLKSLRKENRIVGVISHVEEMQQEIDTHLRIVNDEVSGSRIYRSWEK